MILFSKATKTRCKGRKKNPDVFVNAEKREVRMAFWHNHLPLGQLVVGLGRETPLERIRAVRDVIITAVWNGQVESPEKLRQLFQELQRHVRALNEADGLTRIKQGVPVGTVRPKKGWPTRGHKRRPASPKGYARASKTQEEKRRATV